VNEELRYFDLNELKAMSLDELRAVWDLVPTERQRLYRQTYEREVKTAGAEGSDLKERWVARELVKRYAGAALIPIGSRWARAPKRLQEAARNGEASSPGEPSSKPNKPSAKILISLGVGLLIFAAMLLMRNGIASNNSVTATSPGDAYDRDSTMTPLALDAQDEVIQGGDAAREPVYPVSLHMTIPDTGSPRVWIVQRRAVQASEWNYDPNPDTASFLNGMRVRPIIGIPWSEENAEWFAQLGSGAEFRLQMNTGAILTFAFEEKQEVRRSDTSLFRQVNPGLVILLLGELDDEGLPTASRTLVTATYHAEQELSRTGELMGMFPLQATATPPFTPIPSPTAVPFGGMNMQVIAITSTEQQITTRVRLYNESNLSIPITPEDIWLALGYTENPPGPRTPAETLAPFELLPGQAADITIVWVWQGEPFASLGVGDYRFAIQLVHT
jgi:hypothetical protein